MLTRGAAAIGDNPFAVPRLHGALAPSRRSPVRVGLDRGENGVSRDRASGPVLFHEMRDLFGIGSTRILARIGAERAGCVGIVAILEWPPRSLGARIAFRGWIAVVATISGFFFLFRFQASMRASIRLHMSSMWLSK